MVPGDGKQPTLGMIVGEAPGHTETREGRPFVGRSGRLLEVALRSFGIARGDVFITNVCKEMPLDSDQRIRRPFPEEIAAWMPMLEREIQNTAPAAILALGRTAQRALTDVEQDIPFGSVIGNVHIAWHPAYVLRQGGENQFVFEDWLEQLSSWAEAIS